MNLTTRAMVPADVAADGKTVIGMDAEVFTAVAAKLGLTAQFVNAPTRWATKKGNPAGVDINAPCGKKIAVQKDQEILGDPYGDAPYGVVTAKKGAITADQVKVNPAE